MDMLFKKSIIYRTTLAGLELFIIWCDEEKTNDRYEIFVVAAHGPLDIYWLVYLRAFCWSSAVKSPLPPAKSSVFGWSVLFHWTENKTNTNAQINNDSL